MTITINFLGLAGLTAAVALADWLGVSPLFILAGGVLFADWFVIQVSR